MLLYLDGHVGGERYRSSVTATYGFHAPYRGRFRLVLDSKGEAVGASWHSCLSKSAPAAGKGKGKGESGGNARGDFDVLTTKPAPRVVFDKPAKGKGGAAAAGAGAGVGGKEGEEEEVVEKTLLQK